MFDNLKCGRCGEALEKSYDDLKIYAHDDTFYLEGENPYTEVRMNTTCDNCYIINAIDCSPPLKMAGDISVDCIKCNSEMTESKTEFKCDKCDIRMIKDIY